GRIVFCSDRTGYLEEYHEERTETLFVMNGDGRGIEQITFAPGTYFEPSVLRDGRILFSFWDAFHIDVQPFDKHETYLMTVNPDGTDERHLFGAGQYRFFNRVRHASVGLTQAREMPDGRILVQSEMGPAIVDLRAGLSPRDALIPIFPGTTSVQLGGTGHFSHLSPLGTRSTPYPLQDGRFLFSATLPGARDSSIYVCDPETREERLVLNIPNYAEFDAVPVLVERPKPAALPARQKPGFSEKPGFSTTRFLVVAGRTADNPKRAEALKKARYFRVVEAEYTGVTSSSHTSLETRILGVVPILPDGSCYFEAPADTPIFLDPIDAAGNRVLMEWDYPNSSAPVGSHQTAMQGAYMVGRAGETKSCYGCHATQTDAVPNATMLALKHGPAKVTRKSTAVTYRRNEPEAGRRQGRIGEAGKYRRLLASPDPELRARACELLMYIEDGAEETIQTISKLLKDDVVEVRRAAALALTRLATAKQSEPLKEALKDSDWQVRFAAAIALESIGVRKPKSGLEISDFETLGRQSPSPGVLERIRAELKKPLPDRHALRAAGKLRDKEAIKLLVPWLRKHDWPYHASEAAVALGRIGTPEAVAALWMALHSELPIRKPYPTIKMGPRSEDYAILQGLILAKAKPKLEDVPLLLALLPNTFMERPRFEDRLRSESQRVLMPRLLLESSGFRQQAVAILVAALKNDQKKDDPLYQQILKGINIDRPFTEHGRPFDAVKKIGSEEALWLLSCLIEPKTDLGTVIKRDQLEKLVVPLLTSKNHRDRIDAAVLLGLIGFGSKTADALAAEIAKPYSFGEIWSIGKGIPDENFRDKAYMVQALARHIDDVNKLKPFADPKTMTRDIRYGVTHGLAFRGKPDGIPLLIEMATRDPITLIRQQARYAIADIQDSCRLAGKSVPGVKLPPPQPLEALYPPRGLTWTDTRFVEFRRECASPPKDETALIEYATKRLAPSHFRNLNNAQAFGAQHMMIMECEETQRAFRELASGGRESPDSEKAHKSLLTALNTPYPYAHYLAANALAERGDTEAIPVLLKKLDVFIKAQDTVGFWWSCEALARLKARAALPALARYAIPINPPSTFGPAGEATGYIAAKALSQIAADAKNTEVERCLKSDNIWLRAGALRGLAEAKVPGIEALLREADSEESPALVRQEAKVQARRLWAER
ncbi:MAG TPA: HEAT repeat domain-containing protein, partial [Gemmataceae bacterium]|nr:HEAT repeat domain-containing protein [Gemmataceae bacterium]